MMPNKVKLNLVGLDGNAFSLMGAFQRAARRQGWEKTEIDAVLNKCTSGNYDNLLSTLMANTESETEDE
jgi:hypothetical protein